MAFKSEGGSMFLAKSAIPLSDMVFAESDSIEQSANFPFTYITAPAGYLSGGYLSHVLTGQEHPILWLRLGMEDRDPANLLLSLIHAGKRLNADFGEDTLSQMQGFPGCLYGWVPAFERLAVEFANTLPGNCALVLENVHQLGEAGFALNLAIFHFLNRLPSSIARILTSQTAFPRGGIVRLANRIGLRDLRVQGTARLRSRNSSNLWLTEADFERVISLSQGRPEVLSGILVVGNLIEECQVSRILQRVQTQDQLLVQIGRHCLQMAGPEELRALAFLLRLGYFHPDVFRELFGNVSLTDGPWLQPLSDGWFRLREVWLPALEDILHHYHRTQEGTFCRAAGLLAEMGAIEIAVSLYLQAQDYEGAANAIQAGLEPLMNYGQWDTLNGWLRQLPTEVLLSTPKLLYAQGEIQAMYGFPDQARHSFVLAGSRFRTRDDHGQTCRSLLADSTLAVREGDERRALLSAQDACALSFGESMSQEHAWANWQLGVLASRAGRSGYAKARFEDACQLTKDPYTRELFQQAWTYAQEMENTGLQQEYHQREAELAERTRQKLSHRLQALFKSPPESLPGLLKEYGWLAVPLNLKLPAEATGEAVSRFSRLDQLVQSLKTNVRISLPWRRVPSPMAPLSPLDLLAPIRPRFPEKGNSVGETRLSITPLSDGRQLEEAPPTEPGIMIYCLGPLRVLNNQQFVTSWPSHKAQLVFKYLLLHRNTLAHKETIMEAFWPDADVESARRNLHQAIYNLRLSLKGIEDDQPIIEYVQEGYRINPDLQIWIDYPVFEQHCTTARQKELAGLLDQAMTEYGLAEQMYMDHLFSEDRYEDWIRAQREYLWQVYLSAATRLAEYHFERKDYSWTISIGHRILQKDSCEENAHQILMRCFQRQGQRQLAIRQYEICRQALREGLDVEPSAATRQLFSEVLRS